MKIGRTLLLLSFMVVGFTVVIGCEGGSAPEPEVKATAAAPVAGLPLAPEPVEKVEAAPLLPKAVVTPQPPRTEAAKTLPVGMKLGERFHDVHTSKLNLKCAVCHSQQTDTYFDPMAQVTSAADKRACLSCHKESGVQSFYGQDWDKASVKK